MTVAPTVLATQIAPPPLTMLPGLAAHQDPVDHGTGTGVDPRDRPAAGIGHPHRTAAAADRARAHRRAASRATSWPEAVSTATSPFAPAAAERGTSR